MSSPVLVHPRALEAAASLASTDHVCRPNLAGVLVRPDGSVVATDGHRLIEVPPAADLKPEDYPAGVVPEGQHAPTGEGVIVPAAACKAAAKEARKVNGPLRDRLRVVAVSVNETRGQLASTDLDRTAREEFRPACGPYPNYAQVFPKGTPKVRVAFNPVLLAETLLAFAKVQDSKSPGVVLSFYGDALGACLIEGDGGSARGLCMPLRLPEDRKGTK